MDTAGLLLLGNGYPGLRPPLPHPCTGEGRPANWLAYVLRLDGLVPSPTVRLGSFDDGTSRSPGCFEAGRGADPPFQVGAEGDVAARVLHARNRVDAG